MDDEVKYILVFASCYPSKFTHFDYSLNAVIFAPDIYKVLCREHDASSLPDLEPIFLHYFE